MATYVDRKDVANEEVFLPVFTRSSVCTYIGVGNKKVSAIYFVSPQFNYGLECSYIALRP